MKGKVDKVPSYTWTIEDCREILIKKNRKETLKRKMKIHYSRGQVQVILKEDLVDEFLLVFEKYLVRVLFIIKYPEILYTKRNLTLTEVFTPLYQTPYKLFRWVTKSIYVIFSLCLSNHLIKNLKRKRNNKKKWYPKFLKHFNLVNGSFM